MTTSNVAPTSDARLPDLLAWRRALGGDILHDDAWVIEQAQAWLERSRWVPLWEAWPCHGQSVEVLVMSEGSGKAMVIDACFKDREPSPCLLWPWEVDEQGEAIPDASLASMNRNDLRDRTRGPCFTMSSGDWSATFKGPLFSRRGMDYAVKATSPLLIITHWRAGATAPEGLTVPSHLVAFLGSPAAPMA